MRQIAFLGLVVFALALPSVASAAGVNCQAPAGTSGIDQYCEVLPGAGGNGTSGHHKKKHVSSQTTQKLQSQGSDGAAILQLTESSGSASAQTPPVTTTVKKHKTHHKKKSAATTPSTSSGTPTKPTAPATSAGPSPGNDPFSAVGNSFNVGSGVDSGFVWVLVGIGLVLVAMAWLNYRTRSREAES
jgi:hypothetical protein